MGGIADNHAPTLARGSTAGGDASPLRTPARVLIVADQPVLTEMVRLTLNHGRYLLRVARTGLEGRAVVQEWQPHLAVVDLEGHDAHLLHWRDDVASQPERLPVIALTRHGDLKTKLAAFESGVDDILTIPFSPDELIARVLVTTRRVYPEAVTFTPVIRVGELVIDILNKQVRVGAADVRLTSLERGLLYLLAANAGRLVTRQEIVDNLWGGDGAIAGTSVTLHVRHLRAKLHDTWRRPRFIATVPGRGYRFLPVLAQDTQCRVDEDGDR